MAQPSKVCFCPALVCIRVFIDPQTQTDVFFLTGGSERLLKTVMRNRKNGCKVGLDTEIDTGGEIVCTQGCLDGHSEEVALALFLQACAPFARYGGVRGQTTEAQTRRRSAELNMP